MSKKVEENNAAGDKAKLDELTLEIYEAKVRDLTEKLNRLCVVFDLLASKMMALGKAQAKFSSDKQDIVEFLNIKVREHEEQITLLEQKVRAQEDEMRERDMKAKADLEHAISEGKRELEQAQNLGARYKAELDQLFEFKGRKDELEFQLKRTTLLLESKEKEYKISFIPMERKVLQDKMLQKVNEAVANFRRVADQQMAETTKRAIRENMAITSQLKKMSAKTSNSFPKNQGLSNKLAKLRLKESDEMLEIAYDSAKKTEPEDFDDINEKVDYESHQNALEELDRNREENEFLRNQLNALQEFIKSIQDEFPETEVEAASSDLESFLDSLRHIISSHVSGWKMRVEELEKEPQDRVLIRSATTKSKIAQRHKAIDITPIIDAIPETIYSKVEIGLPRTVAVQTLPLFLGTDANNSQVRPWGTAAKCLPKGARHLFVGKQLPQIKRIG
ncbi:hypothetical protein BC829DRAFT_388601 [Chytridium lagenaria]|nr:hypothetical protein BC829DRAFT_388601 [Chytridium lagenaria]